MRSIIATILFLIITIVFSILSVPVALIDRSGKGYLWGARLWSKIFLLLYGIRTKCEGLRHIHKHEHYVFASNHTSYIDIPVILACIPHNIRLVLRSSLTRIPIWGWALLVGPFIVIDRSSPGKSKKTLAKAVKKIHSGASVLLFPEGTRTPDGSLHSFKRGAFHLAYQSNAKVLPLAIIGAFEVLPRHKMLPETNRSVIVRIGEPLQANPDPGSDREKEMDLMQRTQEAVGVLLAA